MACGHEMKDCVTGHMQETVELKAQGVARLNFRVPILFAYSMYACALHSR